MRAKSRGPEIAFMWFSLDSPLITSLVYLQLVPVVFPSIGGGGSSSYKTVGLPAADAEH